MVDAEESNAVVVFADDWGRHPSSCQHLIRRLRHDHRILWVNSIGTRRVKANSLTFKRAFEKLSNWRQGLKQVDERMWVVDLPMLPSLGLVGREINRRMVASRLKRILSRLHFDKPAVLTTLPYMEWLIRDLPKRMLIYYCTDDYSYWPEADRAMMQQADRELSNRADRILAASHALVDQHKFTGRCHYLPHGVDFEHFASAQDTQEIPTSLSSLSKPRIGFFGLIYEKIDFGLLAAVSRRFRHGSLVMIGPVAHCPQEFMNLPNVHLLGPQPYETLPRHIAGLDVLLLPYVDDPMIRQSGPLKLRECLASGKPTVSIDVPDVRAYQPFVRIGKTTEEYLDAIEACLSEGHDAGLIHARQQAVAHDGWDRRAAEVRRHLAGPGTSKSSANGAVKTKRRVLHLRTVSGTGGGPEKTLLNSPRFLADSYELRLAYIRPEGDAAYDMPQRARQLSVDLVDIAEHGPADPSTVWRLIKEIGSFRPHLLHAHDYKTNVLAVLLGKMFSIPAITTLHGYVTRGGRLEVYYRLDAWALRHMEHLVAVSTDLYRFATGLGIPRARVSLIENAIDTEEFRRLRPVAEAKTALGFDPAIPMIGAVGRLAPEKGFDLLIKAAARLLQEGHSLNLCIVGDGPQRKNLEDLVAQLGQQRRIAFLGHRQDLKGLYEAMDVFALSSLREGLPNVLLEAMAMETPVVATRISGIPALVKHEESGLLVEPGDADALRDALRRLLGDSELRQRLSHEARQTVATRFSFAVRMQKIRALYDSLLA